MMTFFQVSEIVHLIVLSVATICSFAAFFIMVLRPTASQSPTRKLLCSLTLSNWMFCACRLVLKSYKAITSTTFSRHVTPLFLRILRAMHFSFEIASFLCISALSLYISIRQRRLLNMNKIACGIGIIWMLSMAGHITEMTSSSRLTIWYFLLRIFWDLIAIFSVLSACLALVVYSRRTPSNSIGTSLIMSRLTLTMIAFTVFVTPSIIRHVAVSYFRVQNRVLIKLTTMVFPFFPLCTSLIFFIPFSTSERARKSKLSDQSITQELEGLELGNQIGQGIAIVYKGKWRGAEVAVKMQPLSLAQADHVNDFQTACNEEIQHEAKLMQALTHPNIVLFMEAGFYKGSICIISEFCSNGSLRDILSSFSREGVLWPMKLRLAIGIAQGLEYLHHPSIGLIHRDLKSPNIVVDESWRAKIADFGTLRFSQIVYDHQEQATGSKFRHTIASRMDTTMHMTGLVGTTRWMAPEVITSEAGNYDEKIDVYSFGMILWEMIHHRLPYDHMKWNTMIEHEIVAGNRPEFHQEMHYPQGWKELIQVCWHPSSSKRPTSKEVLSNLHMIAEKEGYHRRDSLTGHSQWAFASPDLGNADSFSGLETMPCVADNSTPVNHFEDTPFRKYSA